MAGDVAQIELLLSQGADINEQSSSRTPLYVAINTQHVEAAEVLIVRGADVNAASAWGTPLHAAAAKGLTSIAPGPSRIETASESRRRRKIVQLKLFLAQHRA